MLGGRGVTEREFTVNWGGNFGWEGSGLCVCLGEGGIVRGTGSDGKGIYRRKGGFWAGIGAKRRGAERSEEQSKAEWSEAEQSETKPKETEQS